MKHPDPMAAARPPAVAEAMNRVRAEFLEMPGLELTPAQAARLCHLEPKSCEAAMAALVDTRFLARTRKHRFARA